MAPSLSFYDELLGCVRAAERDGYAELSLPGGCDLARIVAQLRGFAFRVRFAFRATAAAIERLNGACDGWPIEKVSMHTDTIVLVAQRRCYGSSPSSAATSSFGR